MNRLTNEQIQALPEKITVAGLGVNRAVYINGKLLKPGKSLRVRKHSPDGFNWGYGGSGPAQLALAIMLKYMPKQQAQELYQIFKFHIISGLPGTNFEIELKLREWVEYIESVQEAGISINVNDLRIPKEFYEKKNLEAQMEYIPAYRGYNNTVEISEAK